VETAPCKEQITLSRQLGKFVGTPTLAICSGGLGAIERKSKISLDRGRQPSCQSFLRLSISLGDRLILSVFILHRC
jgi:hypothetical protein